MHILHKKHCRVCGCLSLVPVIDLGAQYLQGSFVKEGVQAPPLRRLPMMLVRCDTEASEEACGLLQLRHSIPPEILYANYWYRSGTNQTMRDHLAGVVTSTLEIRGSVPERVLDIGCNDGTLLKAWPTSVERWGVDPSDIATEIEPPIQVINTVFPSAKTRHLLSCQRFDVVTSIAMFYDLEDPVGFARHINEILDAKGIWVVEMSYLPLMLLTNSFDTICHEHLEYYTLSVMDHIARNAGMRIFKVSLNDINGGSIRCHLCKDDCFDYDTKTAHDFIRNLQIREFELQLDTNDPYVAFQNRIEAMRIQMKALMNSILERGETVHVYGASTKGNVLLQWYGIDASQVPFASDRNADKVGATTLGTGIKIIQEEESRAMKPDYYLVLPWHFKKEFLERERQTIMGGTKMIFPLPEVAGIDHTNIDAHIARAEKESDRLTSILGL